MKEEMTERAAVGDLVLGANSSLKGRHLLVVVDDLEEVLLGLEDAGEPESGRGKTNVRLVWSQLEPTAEPGEKAQYRSWVQGDKWEVDFGPMHPTFGCARYEPQALEGSEFLRRRSRMPLRDRASPTPWTDVCGIHCMLAACLWNTGRHAAWRIMEYPRRAAFDVSVTVLLDSPPEVQDVPVDRDVLTARAQDTFGPEVADATREALTAAEVPLGLTRLAVKHVRKEVQSAEWKLKNHQSSKPTCNSKAHNEGACVEWWWLRKELAQWIEFGRELIRVLEYGLVRTVTSDPPLDGCVPKRMVVMPRPTKSNTALALRGHFVVLRRDLGEWKAILKPLGATLVEWSELASLLNKDKEEGTNAKRRETGEEFLARVREAVDTFADLGLHSTREAVSKHLGFNTVSAFTKRFQRLPGERVTFEQVRDSVLGEREGGQYGQVNR